MTLQYDLNQETECEDLIQSWSNPSREPWEDSAKLLFVFFFSVPIHGKKTGKTEMGITLPKTNIAPTNGWLEYYFPIGEAYFQGLLPLVSGRVLFNGRVINGYLA